MRARQPIREDIDRLDYIKSVLATGGHQYG